MYVQFSLNVICPLCLQAWLAAVSWLDDEMRPAVAQTIWVLIKKQTNCETDTVLYRLNIFNKDSVYFNIVWTFGPFSTESSAFCVTNIDHICSTFFCLLHNHVPFFGPLASCYFFFT